MEPNKTQEPAGGVSGTAEKTEVDAVFLGEPKKSIRIALLVLLVAGGIGCGMWLGAFSRGMKDEEEMMTLRAQLARYNQSQDMVDDDEGEKGENTANYIYVGEWGLKIKVPEELNYISYGFIQYYNDEMQVNNTSLGVFGTVGDVLLDFTNPNKNNTPLGSLTRILKDGNGNVEECTVGSTLVFSDNDYRYCFSRPVVVYSVVESEQALESESSKVIWEMLQNKENYSKI